MLHNRLRSLREAQNITQLQVAKDLDISRVRYNNYETGKRAPDYETLQLLSTYYKVSFDYLLCNHYIKESTPPYNLPSNNGLKFQEQLNMLLNKHNISSSIDELSDEQIKWLMAIIDKAIEMTMLDNPI